MLPFKEHTKTAPTTALALKWITRSTIPSARPISLKAVTGVYAQKICRIQMIMVLKSPGFPVLFVGRVILVSILTCRCNFISCFGLLLLWLLFSCKKKGGGRRDRSGGVVRESDRRCALRTPPNPSIPPFTSLSKGIPCLYCKVWVTMVVAKACLDLPDILNPINSLPFSLYIKPWF